MLTYLMSYKKVDFFFKKKIQNYLYIFFIFLTCNLIEFSTNKAFSKTFVISNVEVEEKYNLNFNKLNVIDRGFKKAFQDLSRMILERKDLDKTSNTSIDDIKKLIDNFSILDEKFISNKYKSIMEVQFNRRKLIQFLNSKNIMSSLPKNIEVFFLPVLVDLQSNSFNYLNDNTFVKHWKDVEKNYFQIKYILPNEDVEDYFTIKNNLKNIENYNFKEIIKKYNLDNYIVMIILKKNETIKLYSKIQFEDKFIVINENFTDKNIENKSDLYSLILNIKNIYEDNWKTLNKISSSTSVPIRLFVEANNIEKSLKLENTLNSLAFVNGYKIEKFDNREVVYKINYLSNPKRFLKDIVSYDIIIDTTSTNWKIK